MPTNNGNIIFSQYTLRNTISGSCSGYINNLTVSGGTPPYTVSWSGISSYTGDTFGIYNLCEGDYKGDLTDITGGTGSTTFTIGGLVKPTITARLSDNSCIEDPNKKCTITIDSAITLGENYRYELRKSDKLIQIYYGTSADTSYEFSNLNNGMYTVTMVENRPTGDNVELTSGCTEVDYNSGAEYSGWSMSDLYTRWGAFVPYAPYNLSFKAGWGPGWAADSNVNLGLFQDGTIHTNDPKVWLYTGATANRLTDTGTDWYLGAYNLPMEEGNLVGPPGIGTVNGDIGKFYFNTAINKFIIRWPTTSQTPLVKWLTLDPRVNYGHYGNPRASMCTGSTYGVRNIDVDGDDRTVDANGKIALASNVVTGSLRKVQSNTNNSQATGLVSACPADNYVWELTLNSTNSDNDTIAVVLHSFRDTLGLHGPIGLRHNLSLSLNTTRGQVSIVNNSKNSAYGFNRYTTPNFTLCNGGCTGADDSDYGQTIILSNSGTTSPLTVGSTWASVKGLRIKITRDKAKFKVEFTDPLDGSIGDARPYNSVYDINFDLNNSNSWSGNTKSAPTWVDNNSLLKYKTPGRIGIFQSSQPQSNWYHFSYHSDLQGPSTTVVFTATTGTTANILTTQGCRRYNTCNNGVPVVKPKVSVTLQSTPTPVTSSPKLARPSVTPTTTIGNLPVLPVYNATTQKTKEMTFYFGGSNEDLIFGTSYPKFRIYPYVFETEEVATAPDYEFIFDTLPYGLDNATSSLVVTGSTDIPLSALSTDTSWEFIVRQSYLIKDKKSLSDMWFDSAEYPPSKKINYDKDYYMIVVKNPSIPILYFNDFKVGNYIPLLMIEHETIQSMPATDGSSYALPAYSTATHTHTLNTSTGGRPLVSVNGITLRQGTSGTTALNPTYYGQVINPNNGDYHWDSTSRVVKFFPETVQNGDEVQYVYDAKGGAQFQTLQIPATVSTTTTETIYQKDDYYYINLDKQSSGGVIVTINGAMIYNDKDYIKVSDSRIQLLGSIDTFTTGDIIALWYRTIYTVIGLSSTKTPKIPVSYYKDNNLQEEIIVRLFNNNGTNIREYKKILGINTIGKIYEEITLKPPTFGTYSYDVMLKRYYPILNGKTIQTESQTERVTFKITRDTFYSPSLPY